MASHILFDEVEISINPGVNPGKIRPAALHTKAGNPEHAPPLSHDISQQGTPRVPIASVGSTGAGTELGVPDIDVDILVSFPASLTTHHLHPRLSQSSLCWPIALCGAPSHHHRILEVRFMFFFFILRFCFAEKLSIV